MTHCSISYLLSKISQCEKKAQLYLPTQLLYLSGLSYQRMISKHCSPLFHKHIYQINSSAQVHLMHSQYVRAFWTLFAFSWSFIYPRDISNLYVLSFQVSFLNKYCKFFIHSWLSLLLFLFDFFFLRMSHHMTFYNFNFPSTFPRPVKNSQITCVEYQGPNNWQIKIRSKHGWNMRSRIPQDNSRKS